MWPQISKEISKLQQEPPQQANQTSQAASLQAKDEEFAEIVEEIIAHWEEVSILSQMHLWQVEEMKAQSREKWCLSALVEQQ